MDEENGLETMTLPPADLVLGVSEAMIQVFKALKVDLRDENFQDTPVRFASYLARHFKTDAEMQQIEDALSRTFPSDYKGMITQKRIRVHGMCPHHLLPIEYDVSLAYIPEGRVLGLSKLARIAELYGTLAKLQEQVTQDIADALIRILGGQTKGVAVVVEGEHSCMTIRGVKAHEATTVTSVITGVFRDPNEVARQEFLDLIKRG